MPEPSGSPHELKTVGDFESTYLHWHYIARDWLADGRVDESTADREIGDLLNRLVAELSRCEARKVRPDRM
jgi:hypothetical protein